MNFVADGEPGSAEIVERLRRDGHTVTYIAEMDPGVVDETVLHLANRGQALLLTADKDFGELVFRQRRLATGVVLLRLAGLAADRKASLVARALAEHSRRLVGTQARRGTRAITERTGAPTRDWVGRFHRQRVARYPEMVSLSAASATSAVTSGLHVPEWPPPPARPSSGQMSDATRVATCGVPPAGVMSRATDGCLHHLSAVSA